MTKKQLFLFLFMAVVTTLASAQKDNFRLLSYNVRNGKGMDGKTDYNRIVSVLANADADVIALQELDSMTKRSNGVDVLSLLAKETGLQGVFGAAISYGGGKYGVGVLSKQKPLANYTVPLPGREEQRVLLVAEFKDYVIFCTHLSLTDADRLTSVAIIDSQAARYTKPVYLLGDLNAEPSSSTINALKANWKQLSTDATTFPSPLPTKCIDYVFGRNTRIEVVNSVVLEEPMASDHRPLLVELK